MTLPYIMCVYKRVTDIRAMYMCIYSLVDKAKDINEYKETFFQFIEILYDLSCLLLLLLVYSK